MCIYIYRLLVPNSIPDPKERRLTFLAIRNMAGQKWAISKSPDFTKFLTRKSSPEESKLDKLFANVKVQRFSSATYVILIDEYLV